MTNLAEWLLACIAEDERIARDAGGRPWMTGTQTRGLGPDPYSAEGGVAMVKGSHVCLAERPVPTDQDAQVCRVLPGDTRRAFHIARHDPARVLAECDAKGQIVKHAQRWEATLDVTPDGWTDDTATAYRMAMHWTLRVLALPYADRPGYREEWRP